MIRNVVVHVNNEQPLLADLPAMPTPGDVSLVCTNLRTMNGKRPVFADDSKSIFVFPYAFIRFLEIPPAAVAAQATVAAGDGAGLLEVVLAQATSSTRSGPGDGGPAEEPEEELEIDEDFLRRIREA